MSTRSGKRIHGSFHENAVANITEIKSEIKPRGKRQTENINEVATEKKRRHYVRYPSEEDIAAASNVDQLLRRTRKSQRNTLREPNAATDSEASNDDRKTRRTRKTRNADAANGAENIEPTGNQLKAKGKSKRKNEPLIADENKCEPVVQTNKKKSNKKNKRKSGSLIIEDIPQMNAGKNKTSNISVDSFHSAAGSPIKDVEDSQKMVGIPLKSTGNAIDYKNTVEICQEIQDVPSKATRSKINKMKNMDSDNIEFKTKNEDAKCKRKLTIEKTLINNATTTSNDENIKNIATREPIDINTLTQENQHTVLKNSPGLAISLKNSNKKMRSKMNSTDVGVENKLTFEIETVYNIKSPDQSLTLDTTSENYLKKNSTYDKINISVNNLNSTFEKDNPKESDLISAKNSNKKKRNSSYNKINADSATHLDATFEKDNLNKSEDLISAKNSNKKKRNTLYNKINADTATNLNATFEKDNLNESEDLISAKNSIKKKRNSTYNKNDTFEKEVSNNLTNESDHSQDVLTNENSIKESNKKKKSSIRKSICDKIENTSIINLDATYEKDNSSMSEVRNSTYEKQTRKSRRSSKFSLDHDVSMHLNTTYDQNSITENQAKSGNNSTFDKLAKFNTTFEMVKKSKDATFEKSQNSDTRRGSSLLSSDTTDAASEMLKDISRVSITSDESMAENIVNTTPVLIESSMDQSQINISSDEAIVYAETINATLSLKHQKAHKDTKDETFEGATTALNTSKTPPKCKNNVKDSTTPLKRDGTHTLIKYATPPKREGTFTELNTARTPLKREGTYTELNPTTTPSKNDLTSTKCDPITPLKLNGIIENKHETPPLKREGTFTKEDSDVLESPKFNVKTPTRRKSLPSPGRTPFPMSKSDLPEGSKKKSMLNVTRSIEKSNKRLSSVDLHPRATRVMFCSPVDTPAVGAQIKGKVIKSNLKGSDKSFVFDESAWSPGRGARKRSHTQSEAEAISGKRMRLEGQQQAAQRLSRPRTSSASGKLQDFGTPTKKSTASSKSKTELTPSKTKSEGKVLRTKLPNFAALHQKRFAKMESLDECQERKAKRARQLLTPTGPVNVLERVSPKESVPSPAEEAVPKKADTPKKSTLPADPQGYTRFGFKLNLDVNPFSFPAKTDTKPKENKANNVRTLKRQATLPSLAGATAVRKEVAKQAVLREKSFTEKRDSKRKETRTVIKGVRTNRRFELQMSMRNVK